MAKNWTKIQLKYKGLWVALDKDEETVLATGKTLLETIKSAKKSGHLNPIMTKMPETLSPFVGAF